MTHEGLRKVAKAATPGIWAQHEDERDALVAASNPHESLLTVDKHGMAKFWREEDCAFAAAVNPQVITTLLDKLEAQAALLRRCKGVLIDAQWDESGWRSDATEALAAIEAWEKS